MSERKSKEDEVFQDYILSGTSWTPLKQIHFMNIVPSPEFRIDEVPQRTLGQVLTADFLQTAEVIRRIYIPNYQPIESEILETGWFWVNDKGNKDLLLNLYTEEDELKAGIPLWVLINEQTLSAPFLLKDPSDDKRIRKIKVAFDTGKPECKADIHRLTLDEHDLLRIHDVYTYGKKIDPKVYSTSRLANLIKNFYWSGGDHDRGEAIDSITWTMFMQYRLNLIRRRKMMITEDV